MAVSDARNGTRQSATGGTALVNVNAMKRRDETVSHNWRQPRVYDLAADLILLGASHHSGREKKCQRQCDRAHGNLLQ